MHYKTQKVTDFKNNLIIILIIYYSMANIFKSFFCDNPKIIGDCSRKEAKSITSDIFKTSQ
uniref:Uncharacterized protein n=1 Tax=Romanomermis culicivorax TaxID=13658 RepID=A0A915JDD7_ROMCU